MSEHKPEPKPFNPTWLTVGLVVLSGCFSGTVAIAVTSNTVSNLVAKSAQQDKWIEQAERRFSSLEKDSAVYNISVSKDLEALKAGFQRLESGIASLSASINNPGRPARP